MPFRTTQPKLGLEVLEPREVPAVLTLYDEYLDPLSTAQAVSSPAPDGTGPRFEPQNVVTSTVPGTALTRNAEARIDRDVQPNGTVKVSARASVNPDYGKIFAFSTAGVTLRLIYRIDPSGGENIGDPVNIALALTGTTTSKNTGPDVGAAFLSGSASGDFVGDFVNPGTTVDSTWVLKGETIGSFVTLVIGARGQAIQSQGQPTILEAGATLRADLTIQPLARDVSPTSLAWDAVKGGVNLSYTNSEALPAPPAGQSWTYNLFWADRTGKKISAGLLGAGLAMDRGKGRTPSTSSRSVRRHQTRHSCSTRSTPVASRAKIGPTTLVRSRTPRRSVRSPRNTMGPVVPTRSSAGSSPAPTPSSGSIRSIRPTPPFSPTPSPRSNPGSR